MKRRSVESSASSSKAASCLDVTRIGPGVAQASAPCVVRSDGEGRVVAPVANELRSRIASVSRRVARARFLGLVSTYRPLASPGPASLRCHVSALALRVPPPRPAGWRLPQGVGVGLRRRRGGRQGLSDDMFGGPLPIVINAYEYRTGPASRPRGMPDVDLSWRGVCTPKRDKCSIRVLGAIAFLDDREAEDWGSHPFASGDAYFHEWDSRTEAWLSVTVSMNLASRNEVLRAFQMGFGCRGMGQVVLSLDVDPPLSDDEQKSLADGESYMRGKGRLGIRGYTLTSAGSILE